MITLTGTLVAFSAILLLIALSLAVLMVLNRKQTAELTQQLSSYKSENGRLHQYRHEADTSQRQLQSLIRQYSQLETRFNEIKSAPTEQKNAQETVNVQSYQQEILYLQDEVKRLNTENQKLQDDVDLLSLNNDNTHQLKAVVDRLQQDIEVLQQERLENSLKLQKYKQAMLKVLQDNSGEKVKELESSLQQLTAVNQRLNTQLAEYKSQEAK